MRSILLLVGGLSAVSTYAASEPVARITAVRSAEVISPELPDGPALGIPASPVGYPSEAETISHVIQGPSIVPPPGQSVVPHPPSGKCAHKCCKTVMQPCLVWKCCTKPCDVTVHRCKETGATPFCDSCCDEKTGTCTEVYGVKLRKDIVPTKETWHLHITYQCIEYRPQCVCCDCGVLCDCPDGGCHPHPHTDPHPMPLPETIPGP